MKLIKIEEAISGDILSKTLNGSNGRPLVKEGAVLTDNIISLLVSRGFNYLYIEDESKSEVAKDVISPEIRLEAMNGVQRLMIAVIATKTALSQDIYSDITGIVNNLIEDLLGNKILIIDLVDLKNHDDYTFVHSVNVAILCLMIGISLGYTRESLKELGLGAMLHDIGKKMIPLTILNKPGKLTDEEFEIIKNHSQIGYDKVKDTLELGAVGRSVILQHHEKLDGTGYPRSLKEDKIHEFAKIAAIADVYDALTSDRSYRKRFIPSLALEYLYGACGSHFDLRLVKVFADHIAPYPTGCRVKLSNGMEGIVSDISANSYRPIIRIGNDALDLNKQLNLVITDVMI